MWSSASKHALPHMEDTIMVPREYASLAQKKRRASYVVLPISWSSSQNCNDTRDSPLVKSNPTLIIYRICQGHNCNKVQNIEWLGCFKKPTSHSISKLVLLTGEQILSRRSLRDRAPSIDSTAICTEWSSRPHSMLSPLQPAGKEDNLKNHGWQAWGCWTGKEHTSLPLTFRCLGHSPMATSSSQGRRKMRSSRALGEKPVFSTASPSLWAQTAHVQEYIVFIPPTPFFSSLSFHWGKCANSTL